MDLDKCRICLQDSKDTLSSIFDRIEDNFVISTKIMTITNIDISPNDELPKTICNKCIKQLKNCITFIELCQITDSKLRKQNYSEKFERKEFVNNIKKESYIKCINTQRADVNTNENINNLNHNIEKHSIHKSSQHQCFTCGKIMSSRFRLKTHSVTHTKERPYSCDQCGKKFSLAETLHVHMRIHTGEKPFQCPTCGEGFAHSAGLIAHKRKHTGQLPYQCHLCPKRFRTIGHLQYHVCKHTGKTNFDCDTCGRGFISRQDLKQHLMTHVGDKPHVCCVCGLRLSRASNLRRHLKLVHGEESPAKTNTKQVQIENASKQNNNELSHNESK